MSIHSLDPLTDPRWGAFVRDHARASVFHTPSWLAALSRTYGYEPVVYTRAPDGASLNDGIACCRIRSWLGGRRLVSLPFTDHCEPLVSEEVGAEFALALQSIVHTDGMRYVELRPIREAAWTRVGFGVSQTFALHTIDLQPDLAVIFSRFHKDGIQRKIRRAERERLALVSGRSNELLHAFHRLLSMTRRRHRTVPQPLEWFENLRDTVESFTVHLAMREALPVAAIITLAHGRTVVYKYGGSDASHHAAGAMPFLFWNVIQAAKQAGAAELDLGRSDLDNPGLIAFKERLGAVRSELTYVRSPAPRPGKAPSPLLRAGRHLVPLLPDSVLRALGRHVYKHLA